MKFIRISLYSGPTTLEGRKLESEQLIAVQALPRGIQHWQCLDPNRNSSPLGGSVITSYEVEVIRLKRELSTEEWMEREEAKDMRKLAKEYNPGPDDPLWRKPLT